MSGTLNESSLMKHLMDNIRDNIYFMDHDGRIILINQEGAKWLGYDSPHELLGKTNLDLFTNEHGREAYDDEQRIMETGVPILGKEEKETRIDGGVTWVSTSKMPLRNDEGTIVGTFGISRDITDHKESEIRAEKFAEENRRFREEMEDELQMAAELQKTFFPTSYPEFSGHAVQFAHRHHAGGMVGGDFCSVRELSDTEAGIFLCDVMGHGVRAALGTAIVRAIVEEISHQEKDPGGFLNHMNLALMPIMRQGGQFLFATACYMVLDIQDGSIRYANAGHPPPIRFDQSGEGFLVSPDATNGAALAVSEDSQYVTRDLAVKPGDTVFMYTDGIYEAVNETDEEFGLERMLQAVEKSKAGGLDAVFDQLLNASCGFAGREAPEDDICMVGFHLSGC